MYFDHDQETDPTFITCSGGTGIDEPNGPNDEDPIGG